MSDQITYSDNGNVFRRVHPGTYAINADCTGEITYVLPGPPFELTFDVVVSEIQDGEVKGFYMIGAEPNPGGVVTATAKRIR